MNCFEWHKNVLRSKRVGSYKSEGCFFWPQRPRSSPQASSLPMSRPQWLSLHIVARHSVGARRAIPCHLPGPLLVIYRQSPEVCFSNDGELGSCGWGWRPFRPSHLQLLPTHEQRQFSRLTLPGSVLRYFHEKGRVARLSWNVPRC